MCHIQVATKLARRHKVWTLRLEKEKERRELEKTAHLLALTGRSGGALDGGTTIEDFRLPKSTMEKRMEKYTMRRKMKAEERKARLDNERRKQAEAVVEKRRRLVDEAKVPDSKPTKATISRAEKVFPTH